MSLPRELGVNVDHVATLRAQRGTPYPDPVAAALLAVEAGADNITAHLREDRRHIRERDVRLLLDLLEVPLNLEMSLDPEIVAFALDLRPARCCLVPERREERTTEGGLDLVRDEERIRAAVGRLAEAGVAVSLFVDPEPEAIERAAALRPHAVEIHTGRYADAPDGARRSRALDEIARAARTAAAAGLEVHAGHGLHYRNVGALLAAAPIVAACNIGHAVVARALFVGFAEAVREMRALVGVPPRPEAGA
jgi:pyridoxine 5-phosphate synthase